MGLKLTDRGAWVLVALSVAFIFASLVIGQALKADRLAEESGVIDPLTCERGEGCS